MVHLVREIVTALGNWNLFIVLWHARGEEVSVRMARVALGDCASKALLRQRPGSQRGFQEAQGRWHRGFSMRSAQKGYIASYATPRIITIEVSTHVVSELRLLGCRPAAGLARAGVARLVRFRHPGSLWRRAESRPTQKPTQVAGVQKKNDALDCLSMTCRSSHVQIMTNGVLAGVEFSGNTASP